VPDTRLPVVCYGRRESLAGLLFSLPLPRLDLLQFIRHPSLSCDESTNTSGVSSTRTPLVVIGWRVDFHSHIRML
jgi:hypothetical protein